MTLPRSKRGPWDDLDVKPFFYGFLGVFHLQILCLSYIYFALRVLVRWTSLLCTFGLTYINFWVETPRTPKTQTFGNSTGGSGKNYGGVAPIKTRTYTNVPVQKIPYRFDSVLLILFSNPVLWTKSKTKTVNGR